jgi:glutamate/tyrosine decarboxylase-like PLP-dependent enzyme
MDIEGLSKKLSWLPAPVMAWLEKQLKRIPAVRERIQRESTALVAELESSVKPYRQGFLSHTRLPESGVDRERIIAEMEALRDKEQARWKDGFVSGAVYHGDATHVDFLSRVYAIHSQSNPLHADIWPSAAKFEAEIVSMAAAMLGGEGDPEICGTVSSGGTESILLAMKTYRDWARETRGIHRPEIVVPSTAHAAFEKAAQYFKIRLVRVPVGADFRADVAATKRAISRRTIALIGSAPSFPHGTIDPIEELSGLAYRHGIGFHTDACLGGFVLPWAARLGYPVPRFDFALPGVTSISADTHKYGYAAKGTSVILYRGKELRHYQYYTANNWPGGLYCSPTFAGSRPGALSAACWAAMVSMGESGYLEAARRILETTTWLKREMETIPELRLLGDSLFVLTFDSPELDIYRILEVMGQRHWNLNALFQPPAVHLCVTLRHTQQGVAGRFIDDLKEAVAAVKANPGERGEVAPMYGMAATLPMRGLVDDLLKQYLDLLYST